MTVNAHYTYNFAYMHILQAYTLHDLPLPPPLQYNPMNKWQ